MERLSIYVDRHNLSSLTQPVSFCFCFLKKFVIRSSLINLFNYFLKTFISLKALHVIYSDTGIVLQYCGVIGDVVSEEDAVVGAGLIP